MIDYKNINSQIIEDIKKMQDKQEKTTMKQKIQNYIKELESNIENLRKQNSEFCKVNGEDSKCLVIRAMALIEVKEDLKNILKEY